MRATPTLFGSIEIGRRGMRAQQFGLDVVGQNVNNVNTRGYSRQEASFSAAGPYRLITGSGQWADVGMGIDRFQALRYRDLFLDQQFRTKAAQGSTYEVRSRSLDQIDKMLQEPSDSGLRKQLSKFIDTLNELSNRPNQTDPDARVAVIHSGIALAETLRDYNRQMTQVRKNADLELRDAVAAINTIAKEVAELNTQISQGVLAGRSVNKEMDRRDILLDELAHLAGIEASQPDERGQVTVRLGGVDLVSGGQARTIEVTVDPITELSTIEWQGLGMPVRFTSGQTLGYVLVRDQDVPEYMAYLDSFVETLVTVVNDVHKAGYGADGSTGLPFFLPDPGPASAGAIQVNPILIDNPDRLAAALSIPAGHTTPDAGDNGNILLLLAQLEARHSYTSSPLGPTTQTTIPGFIEAMIAQLGVVGRETGWRADALLSQRDLVDQQRMGVAGVSLDEEMTKMIQFQHAYNASARMITTIDEALQTVIVQMGLVGR